jgi:hypothetical protein
MLSMVVIRGGRKVVTVEVFAENYERIKIKASQKKQNIKEYVNDLLGVYLEKEDFIHLIAPSLSIDSYEGNRITVKDVKEKVLVDVFYKNGDLQCEKDQRNNCIHTRFIWMTPEISKITTNGKHIKE